MTSSAGVLLGHPDQILLGCLVHEVDGRHHQDVHDVVGVEHQVQLAREPFLGDVDGPYVAAHDGDEILEDDMTGGVRGSTSMGTESQAETHHSDDEGGGESKAAAPDGGDGHGLVEAEDADPEVEQEEDGLGVRVETVDGGADGDEGPEGLGEPDAQHVHLEEEIVGALATAVTHEQVVESGAQPGGQAGRHVGPGQPRDGDPAPGQQPGHHAPDEEGREGVGEDVDGLVVPVGQAGDAAQGVEGGPVVRVDILVEPQVSRHVTVQQQVRAPPYSASRHHREISGSSDICRHGNISRQEESYSLLSGSLSRYLRLYSCNINRNLRRLIIWLPFQLTI